MSNKLLMLVGSLRGFSPLVCALYAFRLLFATRIPLSMNHLG
jgi:hypothetical protein